MRYYILTLFPEMIRAAMSQSIVGRAISSGEIELHPINIRDFSADRHKKVDDYPYGGGAGMVMQAQPVYDAYLYARGLAGENAPCIYLGPQGQTFCQAKAHELAEKEALILLCGHYEGVDERVLEEIVTDCVSVGDYILTGGELAAMIVCDATARLLPGVLHNDTSTESESFENGLLEYPQYSRPAEWRGKKVPDILLSGDHAKVDAWRQEQAVERTKRFRPDLLQEGR